MSETLSRVSNGSLSPLTSENPSSPIPGEVPLFVECKGGPSQSSENHESTVQHSTQIHGLVGARVQTSSFSGEVGEERRVYGSVVSNKINRSEEKPSLEVTAASVLPLSASTASPILPAPITSVRQPSDKSSPPVEVVTRRRVLNVVNKLSLASEPRSPSNTGTARRQFQPIIAPSRNEGGQLASAAAYIREHISQRSLACNESICHTSKGPPDKTKSNSR